MGSRLNPLAGFKPLLAASCQVLAARTARISLASLTLLRHVRFALRRYAQHVNDFFILRRWSSMKLRRNMGGCDPDCAPHKR
jgi:hypothetical protein